MLKFFSSPIQFKALLILRETFLSLLPAVLIVNCLVVLYGLTTLLASWGIPVPHIDRDAFSRLSNFLMPLFASLSLSTLLAKEKNLDQTGTLLISLICFFRGSGFLTISQSAQIVSYHGSILTSIPLTWMAVWLLQYFSTKPRLRFISEQDQYRTNLSPRLADTLNLIGPGFLTVLCVELFRQGVSLLAYINPVEQLALPLSPMGSIPELILFQLISLCAWFVGLHGEHSASGIFRFLYNTPSSETMFFQLQTFYIVFVPIGGAGATLPIPFIILWSKRLYRFKAIAQLSLFFALFNINEMLLFGLPIILNPIFLIPFISTAFVNTIIALSAIHFGLFSIDPAYIHWMLPPLYKSYVASHGSPLAVLTEFSCIVVDGCIYYPFLIAAAQQYEAAASLSNLFSKHNQNFLPEAINQRQETAFLIRQSNAMKRVVTSQKLLNHLSGGRFLLYFQPKVAASSLDIIGLEALLRFQDRKGKIHLPTFLPTLYRQGLSKSLDREVVDLIFQQLNHWRTADVTVPTIALNFDKDFLLDTAAIKAFIQRSQAHNVRFCIEITEHTYVAEIKALASVVYQLRAAGHRISIDDFGTGYSSLTSLVSLAADEVKLDRALAVPPTREVERGTLLLRASVQLCHNLGFSVVAEGIETQSQLQLAQSCGVDVVQGYYLGHPMNAQQISRLLSASAPSISV